LVPGWLDDGRGPLGEGGKKTVQKDDKTMIIILLVFGIPAVLAGLYCALFPIKRDE